MCRLRHIAALPLRATPPLPFTAGNPTETAFSTKKEKNRRGKFQKNMQRLFLAGRSAGLPALGGGAWFHTLRWKWVLTSL